MLAQSFCILVTLTWVSLDSYVPYVDTLYVSNDYSHAVLVMRKRDSLNIFFRTDQGPVEYIICRSKVKAGEKKYRAMIEDTSNGFLTKGFKFNLNELVMQNSRRMNLRSASKALMASWRKKE